MIPTIALIGAGKFGQNHLKTLIELDKEKKIDFFGVVELDSKIRKNIEREFKIKTTDNIYDFLDLVDGFDVVTPPSTHYKIVKFLLMKKKHVFVEKPLTVNPTHAKILANLAKKNKKTLQVGHIFRYDVTVNHLKKILKNKTPYQVNVKWLQNTPPSNDSGAIFVYMHGLDVLDYLFDIRPSKILSITNLMNQNLKFEIFSTILINYDQKFSAIVSLGWIPSGKNREIEILTKNCHIICAVLNNVITIKEINKPIKTIIPKGKFKPLFLELEDFIKSIKNNTESRSDGKIGERMVKLCYLATKSIETKRFMKI